MDTKNMTDLSLPEFYAATMQQAGIDVASQHDMVKQAAAQGIDPTLASLAKCVYDQSLLDRVDYNTEAERLTDSFKIASAWMDQRAELEANAVKIAQALRVAAEKAVMQLIDEFDLDVEVDDAIKIAAFQHLPPLDEEKTAMGIPGEAPAPGAGVAQPTAPPPVGAGTEKSPQVHPSLLDKQQGMNADRRLQKTLATLHTNNDAGEHGILPVAAHEAIGGALRPDLDPKHHKGIGEQWSSRYVPDVQHTAFINHAGQIAAESKAPLTADQLGRLAKDRTEGVSDNKFIGTVQKNWKPLAVAGGALGVGAAYYLHKRKQRQERETYLNAAKQRAGIAPAPVAQ